MTNRPEAETTTTTLPELKWTNVTNDFHKKPLFKTQRNVVDNSYYDSQSQLTAVGSVSVSIDEATITTTIF